MKTSQTDTSADVLHNEAHVWLVTPESVSNTTVLQRCHDMLDGYEHEKLGRFLRARDRHHYLISHALVRSVLSRYTDIAPCDWRFSHGPHGRPEVITDKLPGLRFNLTHTAGLAACIVTLDDDCGIDAEQLHDRSNPLGVAQRMFSEAEIEQLKQREGNAFLEYFYEHWTLREAYVKALGIGISFPTRKLHFDVEGEKVTVEFDNTVDDRTSDWQFQLIRPDATHIAAIALRRRKGADKRIHVHYFDFDN